ncbi:hydrogenase maturation nickel metallochaperone HypA [Humisphaera borealis]|uniref:Hydrogenase maturation factor HypA n=2 Tax=Humisphaera borealis TaxID=2807512 RepID=A0A7M2X3R6_9BACT|nr:hydrogenase maturation nickel metallochaperone HypA [Humisphaera borealis]
MHELSIAQSLVELMEDELIASRSPDAASHAVFYVGRVVIKVGALSGVVPEALASAFPVAISRSSIRGATLTIEEIPVTVFCPTCDARHELSSPQRLRCPVCDTPTPDVVGGRELELVSIEVLDDNDSDSPTPHP